MKIGHSIFLLLCAFCIGFGSCKKDTDPNMETFKIVKEMEKITVETNSATISGTYQYSGKINSIKVRVGTNEQLFGSDVYVAEMSGKSYSVNITGLRSGTKYYYRYEVDYGAKEDYLTEIYDFTTLSEAPTVKILAIDPLNNDSTSFRITCKVDANGGAEVTECGICWNNYPNGNPTLDDEKEPYTGQNNPNDSYDIRMENLPTRTVYHVKAYAKSSAGTGFSEKESFRTGGETTKPQVSTVEVSNVTYNAATCLCNVSSDGGLELYERGVCWGLELNPILKVPAEGTEIGNYTVTIEGLDPNTDYHVRAYAINEKGISYGEDLPFRTTDGKPTVTTSGITDITSTSAKGGGEVTDQGASAVTERGICWSTSHEPMATGNHATSGAGTGSFICDMTNLIPNQTYYVRAYATNSKGTAYGDEVDFIAMEGLPSVETVDVTNVTTSGAKVNYKVTIEGGLEVDEHGICWSESNTIPTINDHYVSGGNGTGTFSVDLSGLNPGTKYYVRAYAKNEQGGEAYGTAKDFTTEATLPTVTTDGIEGTTAHGTVTADGGKPVTERGICWGLNHNPTTADLHDSNGTGLGSYAVPLTDLQPGKTYYYRAYATNEMGTAYGLEGPPLVVEANPPTVNTGEVSNIQQTTALGGGNVTDDGGADVTERGVCWSTNPNPTIANSNAHDEAGGLGNFTVPMTGLTANTHYYVRAYAKNSEGKIGYGGQTDFTTAQSISAPTVTTLAVTSPTQTTATGNGNVTNDGGSPITERGVCWGTSHNPSLSGSHASCPTNGTGTYQVSMTGLTPGTLYYVRAYARNSAGLSYAENEVSFSTGAQQYTITVSASTGGSAHVGSPTGPTTGTFTQGQQCTVYAVANSNYTFTNWTEGGQVVQGAGATYTFPVTANRNLVANFTYTPPTYTITVSANPSNGGSAHVGSPTGPTTGTYTNGQQCTVYAVANSNYTFANWTENGTVVSTQANYQFTVNSNRALVANFIRQYTIAVSANPSNGGTVSGGGTYNQGASCTVHAQAATNYQFTNWTEGGTVVSTQTNYTFTVNSNRTLVANFTYVPPIYTITVSANPSNGGTVSGGGTFNQGASCTVHAQAVTNYQFTNWTEGGTVVFTQANYTFTVNSNRTLVANFTYNGGGSAPQGAINGKFTIDGSGGKVYFSQGNLQYIGSSQTWKFADHQWDVLGTTTGQNSTSQTVDRDLFGWGTSGWDNGNVYYQPYDTQNNGNSSQGYGYGPTDGTSYTYDLTGTYANADWGVYNQISNGGGQAGQWRTLTKDEWVYVFQDRSGASSKYGHGKVNGQNGMILLPDEWTLPSGLSFTPGNSSWANDYTTEQWEQMEQNGAVFLPAAGGRNGTSVYVVGSNGYYWSASYGGSYYAYVVSFGGSGLYPQVSYDRCSGLSVRLVRSAQ